MLVLIQEFEKLSLFEENKEDLSNKIKERVNPKGPRVPPP